MRADGEKALEELDKPEYEGEGYMRGHFRARVSLAEDILDMIYKNEINLTYDALGDLREDV